MKEMQLRNREIRNELNYFKENETVDALFAKIVPLVNRNDPSRSQREIRDELIGKVNDFLNDKPLDTSVIEEGRQVKMLESSGVESLLMAIQLGSVNSELPVIRDNPLHDVDKARDSVMAAFKSDLVKEAEAVERRIESHVR